VKDGAAEPLSTVKNPDLKRRETMEEGCQGPIADGQKVNRKIFFSRLTKFSHPLESSLLFLVKLSHA
jgi:hypothetical protein